MGNLLFLYFSISNSFSNFLLIPPGEKEKQMEAGN